MTLGPRPGWSRGVATELLVANEAPPPGWPLDVIAQLLRPANPIRKVRARISMPTGREQQMVAVIVLHQLADHSDCVKQSQVADRTSHRIATTVTHLHQ